MLNLFNRKSYPFYSCMEGTIIPIEAVSDPVFSSKSMGNGFAIIPTIGKVVAPFDGEVIMVFKTKHAIGLKDENGNQFLIHIGLDTVNLKGEGFHVHVKPTSIVKKGETLIEFEIEYLKEKGYSLESCIILPDYQKEKFKLLKTGKVKLLESDIFILK